MQINTETPILHDCHCISDSGNLPKAHRFYRGFILHLWRDDMWCLLPTEMPIEEVAKIMDRKYWPAHQLGNGQQTRCINGGVAANILIDRFWATVQEGPLTPPL
ncbi:hypothetical protein LCGC14_2477430 [marine sediment metagenome]|uniref:Uncharacterized protein n=1 Tax=marine sediment metagenome TaxID=412755 RepID=A0A0F9BWG7_9ZZZZ